MKIVKTAILLCVSLLALSATADELDVSNDVKVNVKAEVNATATLNKEKNDDKTESGNEVSAKAREISGWSENEKQEFLTTVKTHAELKSDKDLDNFAKGVMIKDKNVDSVEADDTEVKVHYKLPAKFLGVFGSSLTAVTSVTFETAKTGRGPKEVTVKFPWYRMFFSLSTSTREDVIRDAIAARVEIDAQYPRDNANAQNGVTINIISSILKALRAKIEASATVN